MSVVSPGGARPRAAARFAITVGALVTLAAFAVWWLVPSDRAPWILARPAVSESPIQPPAVPPPPFRIRGTVLSGATRAALVAVLDDHGAERPEQRVAEGGVLDGYRLARIDLHRVYFEKDGARFMLVVGGSRPEPEPESNAIRRIDRRDINAKIVPPPPGMDIEAERRKFEEFLGKMQQDPKRQEMREKRRREMGDRLEPSPWGTRPSPAPAPP